jgi:hypothetical protein
VAEEAISGQLSADQRSAFSEGDREFNAAGRGREWKTGNREPRMENGTRGRAFLSRFSDQHETVSRNSTPRRKGAEPRRRMENGTGK